MARGELPEFVDKNMRVSSQLDDSMYGNDFGAVPGIFYPNQNRPVSARARTYHDECRNYGAPQPFHLAKQLATINYYETTLDFQKFRNHDLVPENDGLYPFESKLKSGSHYNNFGKKPMFSTCELGSESGSTWSTEKLGPLLSTGGYDWWQIGWADVFELRSKLIDRNDGILIHANSIVVTDAVGRPLSYPPIHVHHIHLAMQPAVRPRQAEYFCGLNTPKPCYNWSWAMEWHGDYECRDDEGGVGCLFEDYPEGYARHLTEPIDLEGEINDVRPRGSAPMEWYLNVGVLWQYKDDSEAFIQLISSALWAGVPGRQDLYNQQTYVNTFPAPIDFDSFAWGNMKMPFNGELVRNKIHSHMTSFYKMVMVVGDVSRIIPESTLRPSAFVADISPSWRFSTTARNVADYGHSSSQAMFQSYYGTILDEEKLDLICVSESDLAEVDGYIYDRKPITRCKNWVFNQGDDVFTLGWMVKKTFKFSVGEPDNFDGTIISRTVPQHLANFLQFVSHDRDSRITLCFGIPIAAVAMPIYIVLKKKAD
ncbi:hypothetical protein AURANDRAFT_68273 [Aureococcus anophagefferens]|uniref:Uncharacterized protein n=1 Tax=Aureococcus anophagefferens TaxID=44056 RepID=F0YP28_AURAN|nr:hypothetical protein AURANDRAFT_68273 [Aureococcus anophagefferens]EGB03132.1 hypothetical protein AURANDRAFT_68273 [Aureococcus anophagefferens]|eukprot:XP_009042167.1 hypothetical protein AURANDRAFT_68273 [Aureococcus anophagefferens]